jgi:hypothetical protein
MYTAIIIGAPPSFLERSVTAQHRQTWRLQEHHLLRAAGDGTERVATAAFATASQADGHSAFTGYFAPESRIAQPNGSSHTLEVAGPEQQTIVYHTWTEHGYVGAEDIGSDLEVVDIIVTGQASLFSCFPRTNSYVMGTENIRNLTGFVLGPLGMGPVPTTGSRTSL